MFTGEQYKFHNVLAFLRLIAVSRFIMHTNDNFGIIACKCVNITYTEHREEAAMHEKCSLFKATYPEILSTKT